MPVVCSVGGWARWRIILQCLSAIFELRLLPASAFPAHAAQAFRGQGQAPCSLQAGNPGQYASLVCLCTGPCGSGQCARPPSRLTCWFPDQGRGAASTQQNVPQTGAVKLKKRATRGQPLHPTDRRDPQVGFLSDSGVQHVSSLGLSSGNLS